MPKSKKPGALKSGRPKSQPATVRYLVFSIFRALDKANRLNKARAPEVIKKVKEKYPDSAFNFTHFQWYFSAYKRLKEAGTVPTNLDLKAAQAAMTYR